MPMSSRWRLHRRFAAASFVATATDGAVFFALTHVFGESPAYSGLLALLGAGSGALVHFSLCRVAVFHDTSPVLPAALRYASVSAITGVLHAAVVALLVALSVPARLAWFIAKGVVYFGWSFPATRTLVFRRAHDS